ncbi:MAG TPA: hypothetical protein VK658_28280 [Chryseolinea sp.]|nr:hypothetical protein [Chryseolinea sp.]
MQITENLRKDILFALPELPGEQVQKIAKTCDVSEATVWRYWKKLRDGDKLQDNAVIVAIAEFALTRKKVAVARRHKLASVEKQLSSIK